MTTLNAIVQIRLALVDTDTPPLLETATGGLTTYSDLYAHAGEDVATAIQMGAGILAGYYAQQPSSVSGGGEGVAWDRARYEFYARIAAGQGGGLAAMPAAAPIVMVPVAGATATDEYSR